MSTDPIEDQTDQGFLKTLALCRKAQMMKNRLQRIGSKLAPVYRNPADSPPAALAHTPAPESLTVGAYHPDLSFAYKPNASLTLPKSLTNDHVGRVLGKRKADEQTSMDEKVNGQKSRPNLYHHLLTHRPNHITDTSNEFHEAGKISARHSTRTNQGIEARPLGSRGSFGRSTSTIIRPSPTSIYMNELPDELASNASSCSSIAAAVTPKTTNSIVFHPSIPPVVKSDPSARPLAKHSVPPDPVKTDKAFVSNSPLLVHPHPSPIHPSIHPLNLPPSPCSPNSILSFPSSFASTKPATSPSPTSITKQTATTMDLLPVTPTPLSADSCTSTRQIKGPLGVTSPSPTLAPRFQPPTGPTDSWPDFGYLGSSIK
ncbi:hypothetical protein [Phaffia rhodozyma]|uniref:Uncharacterized protein n=1 Tax=Phaffia rhodozyma TaxID=264483 RepID=A0A0F7SIC7_PHARH|nr:hypothetical protein [Phaffia rhodozyma]